MAPSTNSADTAANNATQTSSSSSTTTTTTTFAQQGNVAFSNVEGIMTPAQNQTITAQILQCFRHMTDSWNKGDTNGYLSGYLDSPQTRYVSRNTIIRGKDSIVDHFYKRGGAKGLLTILGLEIEVTNSNNAICFGQYNLKDGAAVDYGCFTVHVRRVTVDNRNTCTSQTWKILSDHST